MESDEDYIAGRRSGKVYLSKVFTSKDGDDRPQRFIKRVFDDAARPFIAVVDRELVLRTTPSGKQQISALYYTDTQEIKSLTLTRVSTATGKPHKDAHFSLSGDEITKLLELASLIKTADLAGPLRVRLDVEDIAQYMLTGEAVRSLLQRDPALLREISSSDVTSQDIIALSYRQTELERFRRLLNEPDYFLSERTRLNATGPESVWQAFFEANTWIFGYGLFYIFSRSLAGRKLEQVVSGFDVGKRGKRADALLRTQGRIGSLCFVEIKTHTTRLLDNAEYRPAVWAPSRDLTGAIAQVQRTVESAERNLKDRLDTVTETGSPTGETSYLFRPRSVVVIGTLGEFCNDSGVNETQFSSFELYRRQLNSPEIITYDELYERARFINDSTITTDE